MTELEAAIRAYGEACFRSASASEMDEKLQAAQQAARATPADQGKLTGKSLSIHQRLLNDFKDAIDQMENVDAQAARATPADHISQARDAAIEECAAVCERIVLEEGHSATGHGAYLCRKYIRALKSAPPEKPAGDVSDS